MKPFCPQIRTFVTALLLLACLASVALAAPPVAEPTGAPPALQEWRDWVRYRQEFRQCPLMAGARGAEAKDFLCLWPGVLTLDADEHGAAFAQHWQVDAPAWVPLPGDSDHWPQDVTVDNAPQPVLERDGQPFLWLAAGNYTLRGRIPWPERPQALAVPAMSALIDLRIDGKPIQPLQRDGNQLTLGRSAAGASEAADSVELQVYRKLSDGIPAQLTTRLQLQVSGKPREIQITPALPEHFMATALEWEGTAWPARLDAAGRLLVQVQPGQATLLLHARADAPQSQWPVRLPERLKQEVWSYEAAPALRVTAVTGSGEALAVDPKQAGVPAPWQALPAFAMSAGAQLHVEQRSRGLAADETNRLTLARELWLDFSGDGYFAKDSIDGQMQQGWRFDVAAPYRLQRATAAGEPLLVTQGSGNTLTGVEWRSPAVALNASVRIAAGPASALPVTGWGQTFDQVSATLHLPYGYKLLAAPGADAANDSWLARWTILDIFLAAFIALLAWRLLGVGGGVMAAAYLLLALPEPGAPLWTLAAALALALLLRTLPAGRLSQAVRWGTYAALAVFFLTAIAFAPGQLRAALHPQLERADNGDAAGGTYAAAMRPAPAPAPPMAAPARKSANYAALPLAARVPEPADEASVPMEPDVGTRNAAPLAQKMAPPMSALSSRAKQKLPDQQRYAQANMVQTGSGEPDWRMGQHYNLRWTGPVLAEQTVRLIVSPPWLTRLLRVAMVALLGLLVWRVACRARPGRPQPAPLQPPMATTALAMAVIAASAMLGLLPAPAQAQNAPAFPPAELLQTLQQRLNQPPRCAPDCVSIAQADIHMQGNALHVRLQAHAADRVALPLPKAGDNALLLGVRVDGQPLDSVLHDDEADLAPLSRGVHLVELDYAVPGSDTALHFALQPMRAVFAGQGWQADGIDEDRLINETIHLTRVAAPTQADKAAGAQQFPPYVRVTRTLRFDLDWSVSASVTRIAPREGGLTLALPLLAGEHVTTPGVKVQDGKATISLNTTEEEGNWQSRLDKSDTLHLTAPTLAERAEVWRVEVSPAWHVRWNGVPVTLAGGGDETVFEFHPLPGETLTLTPSAPPAVEGQVRAIDHVSIEHAIGARASQHTLQFRLRASQGGEHAITLPASGMEVLNVMRDGSNLNLRPQDGKLTLPVSPGAQTFSITLREPLEVGAVLHTPVFDLGLPAANIDLQATLPQQRWLLATFGPPVGPAVLYWGELAIALLLALLLTRVLTRRGWSTLRAHHWLLLVLGFSTFSWGALALIVCWLLALDWRQRAGTLAGWRAAAFDGVQIGLVLLSIAALSALLTVIPNGLLGMPDMGVTGHGSSGNTLRWFADQSQGSLPAVTLISLPMWAYRAAMLAWALWLAWSVIGWLRRGLAGWMQGGYWRKLSPWKR
ncbi:MAG: hypothetical protein LBQ32_00130 [Burkholderiaceae bacterium]|jgi:hypothetical protein|nr:hypothetical protein [Burkholderiaceae bacterium]